MPRTTPIVLPWPLQNGLEAAVRALLEPHNRAVVDFSQPPGEAALASTASVSWRIFKNPLSLFIGGVTAVIMELAEPRVRTGVWEHTTFRVNPSERLRRTGLAAMATIYAGRSTAERVINRVRQMHDAVSGKTPSGEAYHASDAELLNWVHATAAFGFIQAYHTYVAPLPQSERDRYYMEGVPIARLYGATSVATSEAEFELLLDAMCDRFERSDIVFEFIAIMCRTPMLPRLLMPVQRLLVRAAIAITPPTIRKILELDRYGLRTWEAGIIQRAGAVADRLILDSHPAVQACRRMGLPANYLYVAPEDAARRPPL
jgi:uncharacterized protein (DUF2236 family)